MYLANSMIFLFVLLAPALLVSAAPTPECRSGDAAPVISLSANGWSLPPTSYGSNQQCQFVFNVPKGSFAILEYKATNLKRGEQVQIQSDLGYANSDEINDDDTHDFSDAEAWPTNFNLALITADQSTAQFSLNITLKQEAPTANIVRSYVTYVGGGTVFLDTSVWNDGESYKFTSRSDQVYITVASLPTATGNDKGKWNNVFIYEKGAFVGTLANVARSNGNYVSNSNEVILYMAKRINGTGAAVITDYNNADKLQHTSEYLPNDHFSLSYGLNAEGGEAALTLVSSRFNPRNITIHSFTTTATDGFFSYNGGGPLENHSVSYNITAAKLPLTLTVYANTFYLNKGSGNLYLN